MDQLWICYQCLTFGLKYTSLDFLCLTQIYFCNLLTSVKERNHFRPAAANIPFCKAIQKIKADNVKLSASETWNMSAIATSVLTSNLFFSHSLYLMIHLSAFTFMRNKQHLLQKYIIRNNTCYFMSFLFNIRFWLDKLRQSRKEYITETSIPGESPFSCRHKLYNTNIKICYFIAVIGWTKVV